MEYSQNYSVTSGSLWNCYREEIDDTSDVESFIYKTKIVGYTQERLENEEDANRPPAPTLNVEVTIPLKYLSKFGISLDLSLINCEIEFDLSWKKDCILIEQNNNITGVNFVITNIRFYVPGCCFVY